MTPRGPVRYEGDTWDLASSVGATATMVAAARAMASAVADPVIDDPFALPLVRAVGIDVFTQLAGGELGPEDFGGDGDDPAVGMQRMADNMAVRTRYFDEFFLGATAAAGGGGPTRAAGVDQAVILASGLDSRAYRLPWPAQTTVYEVDQPEVIEFKTRVMADLGAEPTADRRTVAVDLRYDWPAALRQAGFDPTRPTAWSAEGLLGYLPPPAQDQLLDTITALSAVGSRIATESVPAPDPADEEKMKNRMNQVAERWRDHGFELDFTSLIYFGDRNEPAAYLSERGWQMSGDSVNDLLTAHGLPLLDDEDSAGFAKMHYVSGTLTTAAAAR